MSAAKHSILGHKDRLLESDLSIVQSRFCRRNKLYGVNKRLNYLQSCSAAATEHSEFCRVQGSILETSVVSDLVNVMEAQGYGLVDPFERKNMHPLLIPLGKSKDGNLVGLIRWPKARTTDSLTVVQTLPDSSSLSLLARSPTEYIHRALVEEDFSSPNESGNRPVSDAAGDLGKQLYTPGDAKNSSLPSLDAYIVRRVGMFCDTSENLVQSHLNKDDKMSSLITAEWYMRDGHFPDWGRPYEYVFELMKKLGREEESRDIARLALRSPWWSLSKGFQHARDAGALSGNADQVRAILSEQEEMANKGILQGKYKSNPKTEEQQCLDEAAHALNKASAGEATWDEIRPLLEEQYEKAGLVDVARFVALV